MKALIFDTETTGFFNYKLGADHDENPRICSLAAALLDDMNEVARLEATINTAHWSDHNLDPANHSGAFEVNGHSLEELNETGRPSRDVLEEFDALVDQCELVCAFNVHYDQKIVRGEQRRAGRNDRYGERPIFDIMTALRDPCGLKNVKGAPKNPKLIEAVQVLLDRPLSAAHTAAGDLNDTIELYGYCRTRGLVVPKIQESKL